MCFDVGAMALNSSHHDSGGLVVFLGENILFYHDGVEMEFSKTNNEIMSKVSLLK